MEGGEGTKEGRGNVEEGWKDGRKARKRQRALGKGWDPANCVGVLRGEECGGQMKTTPGLNWTRETRCLVVNTSIWKWGLEPCRHAPGDKLRLIRGLFKAQSRMVWVV